MSNVCTAVVCLLVAMAWPRVALAQRFDTISIKPSQSTDRRSARLRVLANGDLSASGVHVVELVYYAYDVPLNPSPRFSSVHEVRETYDIEAKAPAMPPGLSAREQRSRMQAMIRGLLADRFKLVMRIDQTMMPVYALTVASGGPHLEKSAIAVKDCVVDTRSPDSCRRFAMGWGHPLTASAIDMDDLALYIEHWTDRPVVNRTALDGLFATATEGWKPQRLPPPPPGAARVNFDDLPPIFTVLRKLGLELKQEEAAVPVYTVERIERPAIE